MVSFSHDFRLLSVTTTSMLVPSSSWFPHRREHLKVLILTTQIGWAREMPEAYSDEKPFTMASWYIAELIELHYHVYVCGVSLFFLKIKQHWECVLSWIPGTIAWGTILSMSSLLKPSSLNHRHGNTSYDLVILVSCSEMKPNWITEHMFQIWNSAQITGYHSTKNTCEVYSSNILVRATCQERRCSRGTIFKSADSLVGLVQRWMSLFSS